MKKKTGLLTKVIKLLLHEQNVYPRFKPLPSLSVWMVAVKPAIRKFTRKRVYVPESNNQFDADLLFIRDLDDFTFVICKYKNGINYLLIVVNAFNKYARIYPIKKNSDTSYCKFLKCL